MTYIDRLKSWAASETARRHVTGVGDDRHTLADDLAKLLHEREALATELEQVGRQLVAVMQNPVAGSARMTSGGAA